MDMYDIIQIFHFWSHHIFHTKKIMTNAGLLNEYMEENKECMQQFNCALWQVHLNWLKIKT